MLRRWWLSLPPQWGLGETPHPFLPGWAHPQPQDIRALSCPRDNKGLFSGALWVFFTWVFPAPPDSAAHLGGRLGFVPLLFSPPTDLATHLRGSAVCGYQLPWVWGTATRQTRLRPEQLMTQRGAIALVQEALGEDRLLSQPLLATTPSPHHTQGEVRVLLSASWFHLHPSPTPPTLGARNGEAAGTVISA